MSALHGITVVDLTRALSGPKRTYLFSAPPVLGQHLDPALVRDLGYALDDVTDLRGKGII
jgi:hypothetical protein